MGLETIAAALFLGQGLLENDATQNEARALKKEASMIEMEGVEAASKTREEGRSFLGEQALSFIRSGISLEGSPLLVLEKTQRDIEDSASSLINRSNREASLTREQARRTQRAGTSSIFGGLAKAFTAGQGGF